MALSMGCMGAAKAATPSFSCSAAKAPIEKIICSDDALAQADAEMAKAYQALRQTLDTTARSDLLQCQRKWLQARFSSCNIPTEGDVKPDAMAPLAACLGKLYQVHTAELTAAAAVTAHVTAALDRTVFPATGRQETILSIGRFGRYAISTKSGQGTAVQLVSRMAGPGVPAGEPGSSDGRLDEFLGQGKYKIVLQSSAKGSGEVELEVHDFAELNAQPAPRLTELKLVQGELDDFQQRSYWLEITERRTVAIEAAGRNLADLRLWRDGNWLVDATPEAADSEPAPGKPLAVRHLVTTLEPGFYLISAYGGPTLPWAKTAETHPFYLRLGIPKIGEGGRLAHIASPFGIDRYIVPASANYFRLELPEAEAADLSVTAYKESAPYSAGEKIGITKKSKLPVAEFTDGSSDKGEKLVTISREAGKPYVLQQFKSVSRYAFDGSGDYWISTIHSGYGDDNIDATAVLTERVAVGAEHIIEKSVPVLDGNARWSRRFNLLGTATAFFHVTEAGSYQIEANTPDKGAEAEYRFEPLVEFPQNYAAPDYQLAGQAWKLEPGYYVLTLRPKEKGKGILSVTVRGEKATAGIADAASQAKATSVTWPSVSLKADTAYTLIGNDQPDVQVGVVLRHLPIDLGDDLPISLAPGQSLDVPVTAQKGDTVTAVAEAAEPLNFAVDKGAAVTAWTAVEGQHVITVKNDGNKPISLTLHETPVELAPETPLPAMSAATLAQIPVFPPLLANEPVFFDVAAAEKRSFNVTVKQPGLYRLETSGLLQTEGAIRTPTVIALDRQSNNGTGRNFLIQQYLGEGDYQLTMGAQGQTQGHLGLTLTPTTLDDGGQLSLQLPARHALPAGHGLAYSFTIAKAGRYHLRALGLNREITMRLEDADGWPLVKPGDPADLDYDFAPGSYRLVVLPQPVDAKIITTIEALPMAPELNGHGPFDLALNKTQSYQWLEPVDGEPRQPDLWRFTLPAASTVSIDLPRGVRGKLHAVPATSGDFPEVNGGETWSRDLPAAVYQLEVSSRTPNNRLDYTLTVSTADLVAGGTRAIEVPGDVAVSIGGDAITEISSTGNQDMRGWLYDDQGKLVASNDDRANDWNFAITGRLPAGKYRLHVEPVGSAKGQTTVQVVQSVELATPPLLVGQDRNLAGGDGYLLPLQIAAVDEQAGSHLLVISARAPGTITGLSLERRQDGKWQTIGQATAENPWLVAPTATAIARDGDYRLRVWAVDHNPAPVMLQTRLVLPMEAKQQEFIAPGGAGVALVPVDGVAPPLGVAAVTLAAPSSFQVQQAPSDLRASGDDNAQALMPLAGSVIFGTGKKLFVAARLPAMDPASRVAVTPIVPGATSIALTLPADGPADGADTSIIDRDLGGGHPILWLAESRLGQPGIALDRDLTTSRQKLFGLAMSDQSAVAVSIEQGRNNPVIKLWNAGNQDAALPLTLRRIDFQVPTAQTMDWETGDIALAAGQAMAVKLPQGLKRLQLALPPQVAVMTSKQGKRLDVIWSGSQGRAITVESDADRVALLSAANSESHVGIGLVQLASRDALPALGGGRVLKQYAASAGTLRLPVRLTDAEDKKLRQGQALRLHVAGAVTQAAFLGLDGQLITGDAGDSTGLPIAGGGMIEIDHQAGLVVAWVDGGDSLLASGKDRRMTTISAASVVPLAGPAQSLKVTLAEPKFLHLATSIPVLASVFGAAGTDHLQVFPNGADLSLYVPAGDTVINLQAADTGDLAGAATVTLTDIVAIGEGLGPRQRLAPGESRLFSFVVPDERDIGVGVRGSADVAHCRLLDATGAELGAGVVQMQHLQKGTYLLAIDAPVDGSSIDVQPAVVGIAKPDGSPPDDVKRDYLSLAGLKPKQQE
jgi:uncharacterized protein YecT (DUF1311 family)